MTGEKRKRAILDYRSPSVKPARPDSFYTQLLPLPPRATAAQVALRSQLIEVLKVQDMLGGNVPIGPLWTLLHSTESEIADCVALIELDPFLKERMMRIANISIAADRVDTTTLSAAMVQLGFSKIRQITFNTSVYRQFAKYGRPEGWGRFWIRSLFVGRVTHRICSGYMKTDGSEYVAGLLQNVGCLLLHRFFAPEFHQVFDSDEPILETERRVLPNTHAEISSVICALALLPKRIVEAVALSAEPLLRNHSTQSPENNPEFLAAVLHLANDLADVAGFRLFNHEKATLQSIEQSAEAAWLNQFGAPLDFALILKEEARQTEELYPLLFGEKLAV